MYLLISLIIMLIASTNVIELPEEPQPDEELIDTTPYEDEIFR